MTKFTREDYEMAAKAAGIEYDADHAKRRGDKVALFGLWLKIKCEPYEGQRRYWNPPHDDGDALRLAVKLRLEIVPVDVGVDVCLPGSVPFACACEGGPDPYAATRHAIFRAAIAIGRAMP